MNPGKQPRLLRQTSPFHDLGLPDEQYAVFEFWSKKYLGDFRHSFTAKELDPKGVATYAIRKTLERPQILSTSRHISQGGVDLKNVVWDGSNVSLKGESNVVRNDAYSIYVRLPAGYGIKAASFGGRSAEVRVEDRMAEIKFVPDRTRPMDWAIEFSK